jgi:protoheme IX farnesyltransferase
LAVSFTSLVGYVIYNNHPDFSILILICGVFLLAGGASALNQFQERAFDARMNRTMNRVLPSGKLLPLQVLIISIMSVLLGSILLYRFFGFYPFLLGIFNVFWYNLLYTNLKRLTPFAVVPGSLTGAVPAFIGWTAAGGYVFDNRIMLIGFFLFIWQIPHFWLLLMKYSKEYEKAGFPSIHETIRPENLRRVTLVWVIATSVVSIMFPVFNVIHSIPLFVIIILLNIWFVIGFIRLAFSDAPEINFKQAFLSMNSYMILFLGVLVLYYVFLQ